MAYRTIIFRLRTGALALIALAASSFHTYAQVSFSSGSTGSDGALDFSMVPSGTTVMFDPTTYTPPLDPSRDNIFNFTTINIPTGVTVRLSGRILSGPVYWLASGNVTINGTLDLSGEPGVGSSNFAANRVIAYPGAGGYAGGLGGRTSGGVTLPATAGQGPAGGAAGTTNSFQAGAGGFSANNFLVPLIGGSGGGGGLYPDPNTFGGGGGAGGGAILIASSTSIACGGGINARGGGAPGVYAAGGAGGGVHLIAATMTGGCGIYVSGSQNGFIRIEAGNYLASFGFGGPYSITATPNLYLPTVPPGSIKAISVNGVNLPALPTGSFVTPDATINTTSAVNIVVQAVNVPLGTVVTLQITSDQGNDMTIQCPALTGTLASSTTTASVTFPPGFSRGYLTATF